VIRFDDVRKLYRSVLPPRTTLALDGLSLEASPGEVLGIAGPNGAGKSTLLNLVLGFLRPTEGRVLVEDGAPRRWVERHGAAYVPEIVTMPGWWRVRGALRRFAVLSGLARSERPARIEQAVAALGLEDQIGKSVNQLSKGNRQRLGIAQALLSDSPLVVLDEPTHGLDPVWTRRFRDVVEGLRSPERVILIASHNLDELERLADRVAILDRGRVTRIAELGHHPPVGEREAYLVVLEGGGEALEAAVAEAFSGAAVTSTPQGAGSAWEVTATPAELNRGLRTLIERGATVRAFYPRRSRLEAAFEEALGE